MYPKISVITINYNNKDGLQKTIESVVGQTFLDFEYIVIDGGSTDGSRELIEKHADKIAYWVSEPDSGIYNAMNKGIKAAKGEFLLFLNSGDNLFEVQTLANCGPYLKDFDIIAGNLKFVVDENTDWIGNHKKTVSFGLFFADTIWHPSTFIAKNAFEKIGLYDENLKIVADWKWFMIGICKHRLSYSSMDEIVSVFYVDGLSSDEISKEIIQKERQDTLSQEFPMFYDDYKRLSALEKTNYKAQILAGHYNQLLKSRIIKTFKQMGFFKKFNNIYLEE